MQCVDHHRVVVVETYDNRRLQGGVSEAGADLFVLRFSGQATTLSYADVKKIKWRSPVTKQVKLIPGATAIVGVIVGLVALAGGLRE